MALFLPIEALCCCQVKKVRRRISSADFFIGNSCSGYSGYSADSAADSAGSAGSAADSYSDYSCMFPPYLLLRFRCSSMPVILRFILRLEYQTDKQSCNNCGGNSAGTGFQPTGKNSN